MTLLQHLTLLVNNAFEKVNIPIECPTLISLNQRPQLGDYQINGVMSAAKSLNKNPIELAKQVALHLIDNDVIQSAEAIKPGFINLLIKKEWLEKTLTLHSKSPQCGVQATQNPQTIVVDYSHPNIAKEMAVHHLRSTVIGDAIARTLSFLGHNVIRQNHIGDWGTQFGMLIALLESSENDMDTSELADLEKFYRAAKKRFDQNEEFAKKARQYVVKLQENDPYCIKIWKKLVHISMEQNQRLYDRLNISLSPEDTKGESAYNDLLPIIIKDLKKQGLLIEDHGAQIVFLDEFQNKDGEAMGVIVQKSDGGYLYSTTDLAALYYRTKNLHAAQVVYCVDARQKQHLEQIFLIAKKANFVHQDMVLKHYEFGMMLDLEGKPFKTREGSTIKLSELLDESELRSANLLAERNFDVDEIDRFKVINALAIGAIKYSDLSKNRSSNYVFNWDSMLSFEGNTAPYLLYAYTRIKSIFKKTQHIIVTEEDTILLKDETEHKLGTILVRFNDTLYKVESEGKPHILCGYLYELAGQFMSFYENCPILNSNLDITQQKSRLMLCDLTANTLKTGLDLLGIQTVERM